MRKYLLGTLVALASIPAAARADTICAPDNAASPSFYACASVSVSWNDVTKSIILSVRNTDVWDAAMSSVQGGYRLVGIGLIGSPTLLNYVTGLTSVSADATVKTYNNPENHWTYATQLSNGGGSGNGVISVDAGGLTTTGKTDEVQDGAVMGCQFAGSPQKAYFQTCAPTYPGVVSFTFAAPNFTQAMFNNTQFGYGLRGISGVNGSSFKCDDDATTGLAPCSPPTETVPEPITMVLLASGLAGVGGAAARKRRREAQSATA